MGESADARRENDGPLDAPSFVSGSSLDRVCAPDGSPDSARELQVADETHRTRLISDIMHLVRDGTTPECARAAGLTFVGWLARRRVEEVPHAVGVHEARESERRVRASRPKAR